MIIDDNVLLEMNKKKLNKRESENIEGCLYFSSFSLPVFEDLEWHALILEIALTEQQNKIIYQSWIARALLWSLPSDCHHRHCSSSHVNRVQWKKKHSKIERSSSFLECFRDYNVRLLLHLVMVLNAHTC